MVGGGPAAAITVGLGMAHGGPFTREGVTVRVVAAARIIQRIDTSLVWRHRRGGACERGVRTCRDLLIEVRVVQKIGEVPPEIMAEDLQARIIPGKNLVELTKDAALHSEGRKCFTGPHPHHRPC